MRGDGQIATALGHSLSPRGVRPLRQVSGSPHECHRKFTLASLEFQRMVTSAIAMCATRANRPNCHEADE